MNLDIKNDWKEAYNNASFYKSKQNTSEYWDMVALSGDDSIAGNEHINLLTKFLEERNIFKECSSMIDVGCGTGKYVATFSKYIKNITAFDYSIEMINRCKERIDGLSDKDPALQVTYICDDLFKHDFDENYDISLAILNPATYNPEGFEKLIEISNKYVIYMTMDTPIAAFKDEPIYNGTNSIEYAEKYLEAKGIGFEKLPYVYTIDLPDGRDAKVPFAFLVSRLD